MDFTFNFNKWMTVSHAWFKRLLCSLSENAPSPLCSISSKLSVGVPSTMLWKAYYSGKNNKISSSISKLADMRFLPLWPLTVCQVIVSMKHQLYPRPPLQREYSINHATMWWCKATSKGIYDKRTHLFKHSWIIQFLYPNAYCVSHLQSEIMLLFSSK